MWNGLRRRASSCASTKTRRDRPLNRSNTDTPSQDTQWFHTASRTRLAVELGIGASTISRGRRLNDQRDAVSEVDRALRQDHCGIVLLNCRRSGSISGDPNTTPRSKGMGHRVSRRRQVGTAGDLDGRRWRGWPIAEGCGDVWRRVDPGVLRTLGGFELLLLNNDDQEQQFRRRPFAEMFNYELDRALGLLAREP
jgi:hypothetical protein